MATPFLFDSGATLTAAQLNAIGAWQDYTPTYTWSSITTNQARYAEINGLLFVKVRFTLGATPSGTMTISLPITISETVNISGVCNQGFAYDSSDDESYSIQMFKSGTDIKAVTGDKDPHGTLTHLVPFTWASGDTCQFLGIFELAPS
tara:strand:+ start:69 stop:512 length:444 start_codon:yes stop_codon:yes gene_type:complete